MYADPIHIRGSAIKVRLNDVECAVLLAPANLNGMQRGGLLFANWRYLSSV